MKKLIIIILLVPGLPMLATNFATIMGEELTFLLPSNAPMTIETKILHTVDGNPRVIKMGEFIAFQERVRAILDFKMPSKNNNKKPCPFKTLVALENKFTPAERDAILHKFIHQFTQSMQHNVFDDLKLVQSEVTHIIDDWATMRNRPDTPLHIFATKEYQASHEEGLKKYITTLAEFDTLLEDLHLFFTDLIYSLPKSFYKYQEALKELHHDPATAHDRSSSTSANS